MRRTSKIAIAGAAAAVLVAGAGTGIAVAGGGGDDDGAEEQLTGQVRERAEAAALEHTGGGEVTGTEADDEESAYEVEVTLDDGTQVDVQLDRDYAVVGTEEDGPDDDGPGDDQGEDDDADEADDDRDEAGDGG